MKFFLYKELIIIFLTRDLLASYKQTLFGPLWIVINPIITSFVFVLIFNKIGKIQTGEIPPFLFFFLGISLWNFLQANTIQISNFYNANSGLFSKVYFPRLIVPISYLLTNSIKFFIQFFIFFLLSLFFFNIKLDLNFNSIFIILYIFLYTSLFSFFFGLLLNAFTYIIKDISNIMTYFFTILFFLTPVAYSVSSVPDKFKNLLVFNPLSQIFELLRYAIFSIGEINFFFIFVGIVFLFTLILIGSFFYKITERNFIDTV